MVKKVLSVGKLAFSLPENVLAYNIREMSVLPLKGKTYFTRLVKKRRIL